MPTISTYAVTTADRYWPFPSTLYEGHTESSKFWTLTVHVATCRYAKTDRNGNPEQGYFGQDGLRTLARYGFAAPDNRNRSTTWRGCKICGTADLSDDFWKQVGQDTIDAKERQREAYNRSYDQKLAEKAAERAREEAIFNATQKAVEALIANHQAEFDALVAALS